MKRITFPQNEQDDLSKRLKEGKEVYSLRVSSEYGKYHENEVLETIWGDVIKVTQIEKINGGVEELKKKYKFFNELTSQMIKDLGKFKKIEIISFIKSTF